MYNEKGVEIKDPNDTAFLNPIRYRGYYYDEESGLYYLKSRYYNPEWGRFISADGVNLVTVSPMQLTDKNLYSYCDNNPIMYVDCSGHLGVIAGTALKGFFGGLSTYVSDVVNNYIEGERGIAVLKPRSSAGEYVSSILSGMIPGTGLKNSFARIVTGVGSKYTVNYFFDKDNFDLSEIGSDVLFSVIGESLDTIIFNKIDKSIPKNYSSFKYQVSQVIPNISPSQVKNMLHIVNKSVNKVLNIVGFINSVTLNVIQEQMR